MEMAKTELHAWAMKTAREILKQMPWDYDPDTDVTKIAFIIEKAYIVKEYGL